MAARSGCGNGESKAKRNASWMDGLPNSCRGYGSLTPSVGLNAVHASRIFVVCSTMECGHTSRDQTWLIGDADAKHPAAEGETVSPPSDEAVESRVMHLLLPCRSCEIESRQIRFVSHSDQVASRSRCRKWHALSNKSATTPSS